MRKIINKKMYDTETAECVEEFENTPYKGNAHYYKELLYRKEAYYENIYVRRISGLTG